MSKLRIYKKYRVISELQKDLNVYIHFFELFCRKRKEEQRILINKIILQENSFAKRVEKIELLDKYFEKNITSPEIEFLLKNSDTNEFSKMEKKRIKKSITVKNFLYFFLFSRRKVASFSNKTRIINVGLFSVNKKITDETINFLNGLKFKMEAYLLNEIYDVLINGWMYLDYLQYNIIVLFYNCLLKISNGLKNPEKFLLNIENVERIIFVYLGIISNDVYKKKLYNGIFFVLEKMSLYKKRIDLTILLFEKLIDIDSKGMTFFNVMLSAYCINYRCFLSKEELINNIGNLSVTNNRYIFSNSDIKKEIIESVKKIDVKIEVVKIDIFHLHYIDQDILRADIYHPWMELLNFFFNQRFWNFSFSKAEKNDIFTLYLKENCTSFHNDLENSIIKITISFIDFLKKVFLNSVNIKNGEKIEKVDIFSKDFLTEEIKMLDKVIFEYKNKDFSGFSSPLTLKLYLSYARGSVNILEKEKKTYLTIDKLLKVYKKLAYKFSDTIILHNQKKILSKDFDKNYKISNEFINSRKEQLIPYYSSVIEFNEINVQGWTILDLFNYLAYYCFNLIYLLSEKEIHSNISKVDQIIKEFETLLMNRTKFYNSLYNE